MPGETIELVGGHVFINSIPLDESAYTVNYVGDMTPVEIPAGSVFLLGDNRSRCTTADWKAWAAFRSTILSRCSACGSRR